MGKKWIVPFAVFIMLLVAWPLRWEHGPTQTQPGYTVTYLKDYWTGQRWGTYYGTVDTKPYNGETEPIISDQTIENRAEQIAATSSSLKPPEYATKEPIIKSFVIDNTQYTTIDTIKPDGSDQRLFQALSLSDKTLQSKVTTLVLPKLEIAKLWAKPELVNDAWRLRGNLTVLWVILVAASFITSAFFFLREGKPVTLQQGQMAETSAPSDSN